MRAAALVTGALGGAALTAVLMGWLYGREQEPGTPREPAPVHACATDTPTPSAPALGERPAPPPESERAPGEPGTDPVTPRAAPEAVAPSAAPSAVPPAVLGVPACDPAKATEAARLAAKVQRLERELARAKAGSEETKTYDLSPETLRKMAANCELRWDLPRLSPDAAPTLAPEAATEAGLTPEQTDVVNEELSNWNNQTLTELRRLYTAVTGDEQAANLSHVAMLSEITDKSEKREILQVFERLSAERAGLPVPPGDVPDDSPLLETFRMLTATGDRYEAALAKRLGPELARELRDQNGGWGSRHSSSYGCPTRN